MNTRNKLYLLIIGTVYSIFFFSCLSFAAASRSNEPVEEGMPAFNGIYKVLRLDGDVQYRRPGRSWRGVSKSTILKEGDRIGVGADSYIELFAQDNPQAILKFTGRREFDLAELKTKRPYGFQVAISPKDKKTEIEPFFKEEEFYKKYAELLLKVGAPYTFVSVFEDMVEVDSIIEDRLSGNPRYVSEGQAIYVFEGMPPMPPFNAIEAIEICAEECWGEGPN